MSWLYWDVAILNIPLSMRTNDDDWAWHYERSGFFSVRLAYRLLVGMKIGWRVEQPNEIHSQPGKIGRVCGRLEYQAK